MSVAILLCWALGAVALWRRLQAIRRSPFEMLSPSTIVIVALFWMYAVGYLLLDSMTAATYLAEDGYIKVLVLAVLSGVAFVWGSRRAGPARRVPVLKPRLLSLAGVGLVAIGAIGWSYFLILSG